jgi:hypothetical protein
MISASHHDTLPPLSSIQELVDRGGTVNRKVILVVTFAVGMIVGVISQHIPVYTPSTLAQTAPPSNLAESPWEDNEDAVLRKMQRFQDRLDDFGKPDSVEALKKQTEAQQGIEEIMTKFREAQNAKWTPFLSGGAVGTIGGALIGAIVSLRLRRSTDASPKTKP